MARTADGFQRLLPLTPVMGSLLRCGVVVLALLLTSACGGRAKWSGSSPAAGGSTAGSATGGSSTIEPEPQVSPAFDDTHPWFDAGGQIGVPMGEPDQILHIIALGMPARATISTHNIYDALSGVTAVEFSASASAPVRLLVSASRAIQAYDYFAARDAGSQWPVAAVEVGLDWRDFYVPLSDMMPSEMGDPDGVPSFWLAFVVEHPAPVEVSLDDVHFR